MVLDFVRTEGGGGVTCLFNVHYLAGYAAIEDVAVD